MLQQSVADGQAYYELSFDPPRADHADEYHHIEVQVAKPGLTARTREGCTCNLRHAAVQISLSEPFW